MTTSTWMNRCMSGVAVILAVVSWSGASSAQQKTVPTSDPVSRLYAAARKERTVVIWGPTDAIIYQRAQAALDKQFPGIKIEYFESIPEPLVQRIIAESQAGKPPAVDIIQSGSLRALRPLIERDMLSPYPGWEQDFGLDAVYAGQRFVGAYNLTLPIAYIPTWSLRRKRRKPGRISPMLNGKEES
jgi:ABC-type glycerol-3-phosphate transport system substrate-binding protein